jgi:hypothetical protein
MAFINEDLIKWQDLSKSLQDLIMRQIKWDDLDPTVQARINSGGDSILKNIFEEGLDGQDIKIKVTNQTLFADDNFRNIKVVATDAELADEMNYKPIQMGDVFRKWYRYTHAYGPAIRDILDHTNWNQCADGQNVMSDHEHADYLDPNKSGWVYNEAEQSISSHYDYEPVAGFINPTNFYTNYFLRMKCDAGWDDDNLMIIAGYCKDAAGVEHTLSLVRGAGNIGGGYGNSNYPGYEKYNGSIDTTFWWGLIYDMGNPTQHILVDYSQKTGPSKFATAAARVCICYITLVRTNSHLECRTTDWSKDGLDKNDVPDWTFTWDLPKTRPAGMSQDEYDNISKMLGETNRVGFGVRSGQPTFSIESQHEIFDDGDIYAMHQDKVYSFNIKSGQWEVKGKMHELLPDKIFLYNTRLEKLYFYKFWNNYQLIEAY